MDFEPTEWRTACGRFHIDRGTRGRFDLSFRRNPAGPFSFVWDIPDFESAVVQAEAFAKVWAAYPEGADHAGTVPPKV